MLPDDELISSGVLRGRIPLIPGGTVDIPPARSAASQETQASTTREFGGILFRQLRGQFDLKEQSLLISRGRLILPRGELAFAARVRIQGNLRLRANYRVQDLELQEIASLLPLPTNELSGRLNVNGTLKGELSTHSVSTTGSGKY